MRRNVLLALSIGYGLACGLLAVLQLHSALILFAVVGGIALGLTYAFAPRGSVQPGAPVSERAARRAHRRQR